MATPVNKCENCMNPFCKSLPSASQELLRQEAHGVTFRYKNEQAMFLGSGSIFIIASGAIMTIRNDEYGNSFGNDIMFAGDMIGIDQLFNPDHHITLCMRSLSPVTGCMVSCAAIERMIREIPGVAEPIIAHFSKRFAQLVANMMARLSKDNTEKVNYVVNLAKKGGLEYITQENISDFLGISRVTVSRSMSMPPVKKPENQEI